MTNQTSTPTNFDDDFARRMAEMDKEIVSDGKTRGELRAAFSKVENKTNWKLPIDAVIPAADFVICDQAAVFFAGSRLTIIAVLPGNMLRVTGRGYYLEIGA